MVAKRICMLTGNAGKATEYRRTFGRYGVVPETVAPYGPDGARLDVDVLARELVAGGAFLVVEETADIYPPGSDEPYASPEHLAPARNVSRARAWFAGDGPGDGSVDCRTYRAEIPGYLDLGDGPAAGFGWDGAFRNAATARSYAEDAALGLKSSARDRVLADVIRDFLHWDSPVDLAHRPYKPSRLVDFGTLPHAHLASNPWLSTAAFARSPVSRLLGKALQDGVFYRSSESRRERNYWLPGLNGGVPLVPKRDDVHETTFQFHDLMHAVMPDLVYDGSTSEGCRRAYLLHRMAGEAVSLVAADYAFVRTMVETGTDYDFGKRRIYPLFASLDVDAGTDEGFRQAARASMRYALLGDPSGFRGLGADGDALAAFQGKYERFFVEDYRWTARNWERMTQESRLFEEWSDDYSNVLVRVGAYKVRDFACDVALRLGLGGPEELEAVPVPDLADAVFDACWQRYYGRALDWDLPFGSDAFHEGKARTNAFLRWVAGQAVMYARYVHVPGIGRMGELLQEEVARVERFDEELSPADIARLRGFHETAVDLLGSTGAIGPEEVRLFKEVVPVFDPMYVFYEAKGEAPTLPATVAAVFPTGDA